jgi:hypothetical protein
MLLCNTKINWKLSFQFLNTKIDYFHLECLEMPVHPDMSNRIKPILKLQNKYIISFFLLSKNKIVCLEE